MAGLSIQSIGGFNPAGTQRFSGNPRGGEATPAALSPPARSTPAAVADFSPAALARSRDIAAQEETAPGELSEDEQAEVDQLKQRDREVRQHEQAHVAAGGPYVTGGPSYEYTNGPDGRRYATGGEVNISVSPGRTPEETLRKARIIRAAALAPAEPSAQDRRVASQASQLEATARRELAEANAEKSRTSSSTNPGLDLSA